MKRILSLILVCMLILTLSACSSGGQNTSEPTSTSTINSNSENAATGTESGNTSGGQNTSEPISTNTNNSNSETTATGTESSNFSGSQNAGESINTNTNNSNSETIATGTESGNTSVPITNDSAEINLNKYVSVSFRGFNLAGYGTVKFDKEKFLLDHIDNVSFNEKNFKVYEELYGKTEDSAAKTILKYVTVRMENNGRLSNGDSVKIVWKIDTEKVDTYFKWDYTCSTQIFTVTGLKDAGTFDPFENVEVTFSGIAPYGKAEVNNVNYGGTYEVAPNENLKNGDKVKVTFSCEDKGTMISKYGKYPSTFEKTYTVSGLNAYVQSFADLSIEQQDKLVVDARELMRGYGRSYYKEAKYCGNYFYTTKGKPVGGHFLSWNYTPVGNAVCFVFEFPAYTGIANPSNVYTVISLKNLLINEKGELVYSRSDMEESFNIYQSQDALEKAYVGVYDDIMNCTNNVKFD